MHRRDGHDRGEGPRQLGCVEVVDQSGQGVGAPPCVGQGGRCGQDLVQPVAVEADRDVGQALRAGPFVGDGEGVSQRHGHRPGSPGAGQDRGEGDQSPHPPEPGRQAQDGVAGALQRAAGEVGGHTHQGLGARDLVGECQGRGESGVQLRAVEVRSQLGQVVSPRGLV